MSIAEKLTAIAENVQKVYEAGKAAGGGQGSDNPFINQAISFDFRELEVEKIEVSSVCAKAYAVIPILANGTNAYNNNGMLEGNKFVKECIALFYNATHGRKAFYDCTNLEYVKICADNLCDSGEVTACYGMFGNCTNLKTIDTVFDGTNCWFGSSAFDNCYRLETVRFKHLTIKKAISFAKCYSLSDESVQSVIDGLFDLTGQTAQTLTFHADVGAKLTDEQKAAITDKNWTLVY